MKKLVLGFLFLIILFMIGAFAFNCDWGPVLILMGFGGAYLFEWLYPRIDIF